MRMKKKEEKSRIHKEKILIEEEKAPEIIIKKERIIDISDELPWHSNPKRIWKQRSLSKINKLIVHQALGKKATTRGVNKYHITPSKYNHLSKRGAPHIAYPFTIEKDGSIYKCNALTDITWQCKGQNTTGLGFCVMGDFNGPGHNVEGGPSPEQLSSTEWLMSYLCDLLNLSRANAFGHDDFGKPACPGFDIKDVIRTFIVSE